jgi:hypothetical protein
VINLVSSIPLFFVSSLPPSLPLLLCQFLLAEVLKGRGCLNLCRGADLVFLVWEAQAEAEQKVREKAAQDKISIAAEIEKRRKEIRDSATSS